VISAIFAVQDYRMLIIEATANERCKLERLHRGARRIVNTESFCRLLVVIAVLRFFKPALLTSPVRELIELFDWLGARLF
jgi:hypothetical protein